MSSEIYYERAYIRVNDDFIPMVCHGSSNCFEFSFRGREIPEKNWSVLNYRNRKRVIFNRDEMALIAEEYGRIAEESGGGIKKSRNVSFGGEEFRRWILNGMKDAYTVEEYNMFGNLVYASFFDADYNAENIQIKSTDDLLKVLSEHSSATSITVRLGNNRTVWKPRRKRAKHNPFDYKELAEYYTLKYSEGLFLSRLWKNRIYFCPYWDSASAKKFKTQKEAERYCEKYNHVLHAYPLRVVRVCNGKLVSE